MAGSRAIQLNSGSHDGDLGLLANGSSGPWEFSVDETISGTERWFAQIEGPSVYVSFEIPSPIIVGKAIEFLAPPRDQKPESNSSSRSDDRLNLTKGDGIPVALVRDDEYEDRYFMVVGPGDSPIVRFTFAGEDLENLVEALRQVEQDIPPSRCSEGNTLIAE
jgi:hypothetical protein